MRAWQPDELQELTQSLVRQYAGAVSARNVARVVDSVARSMRHTVDEQRVVARTEFAVRRKLTDMIARPQQR
ncbi:MAG TPA: hypothetical protein VFR23_13515 [Jiangellaceae bacterium]|nr:hypothetical protein [Jiangellaceae bacterium]